MIGQSVVQPWVSLLPMMQQSVLLELTRGPDGITKYHPSKFLIRWVRRCILFGALDHNLFDNPYDPKGGSFTGPSFILEREFQTEFYRWETNMDAIVSEYLKEVDMMPHHYHLHLMHGLEILGYKHPDVRKKLWFNGTYMRFCRDMHLTAESQRDMDYRLGDSEHQWRSTADPATQA